MPSTSKSESSSLEHKVNEEQRSQANTSDVKQHESDSETQNTSSSEDSIEEKKPHAVGQLQNLKLLASTIDELLKVIEKKA